MDGNGVRVYLPASSRMILIIRKVIKTRVFDFLQAFLRLDWLALPWVS
jgi:hypothetical protein